MCRFFSLLYVESGSELANLGAGSDVYESAALSKQKDQDRSFQTDLVLSGSGSATMTDIYGSCFTVKSTFM